MNKRLLHAYINDMLPMYAIGRANRIQRRLIEHRLARDAALRRRLEMLHGIRHSAKADARLPVNASWVRIQAKIRSAVVEPVTIIRPTTWRLGMSLAVLLLALVWFAFPPKIMLEWSVEGAAPGAFRVYRAAEADSQDFILVEEISTANAAEAYHFVDLQLVPGRQYTYKIEAVSQSGVALSSELVRTDGASALPSQLALLLTLTVSLYGLGVFLSERRHWPGTQMHLRTS